MNLRVRLLTKFLGQVFDEKLDSVSKQDLIFAKGLIQEAMNIIDREIKQKEENEKSGQNKAKA